MNLNKLSTEPYKGVRDFYPEEMAVQNYIFDTWKKVCKEASFEEYTASLLEPAELYRSKGNDEIINEQMFTFIDRGEREVALRPEMTPTLARMIAGRRRSLKFPLHWFSIPNVFRYEKPQRGRKREHWQLNADIMGVIDNDPVNADVEIISLAYKIMKEFGAKDGDFEIHVNNRKALNKQIADLSLNADKGKELIGLLDRKNKIDDFDTKLVEIIGKENKWSLEEDEETKKIRKNLADKGITNAVFDASIVRGFDYYTGMVFEVFDTDPENRRSLFGGGRYDNLLEIFGVEPIPTVGFGMGDVTMKDFLETHKLKLRNE
ncbi:MAG: histidine--tRNA ligase [Candidatus Taylorbacteria bacterium]|nr:histidine--tRNA ligase [Candidatus Taylorbacteria bacterium]